MTDYSKYEEALVALGFNPAVFSIGVSEELAVCLVPTQAGWAVFFRERGNDFGRREFRQFQAALCWFLIRLARDSGTLAYPPTIQDEDEWSRMREWLRGK